MAKSVIFRKSRADQATGSIVWVEPGELFLAWKIWQPSCAFAMTCVMLTQQLRGSHMQQHRVEFGKTWMQPSTYADSRLPGAIR
jgi:hypothetical protein